MRNLLLIALGGMIASQSVPAMAKMYKVEVKRIDKDLYKVVGTDVVIKTRYCYVYSYWDKAILDTNSKKLIFVDQNQTCDVADIA